MLANGIPFAFPADAIESCGQRIHRSTVSRKLAFREIVMRDSLRSACRAGQRICQSVEEMAKARLGDNAHFRGRDLNMNFELKDGVLTIRGSVPSFYLKQLLQTVCSKKWSA